MAEPKPRTFVKKLDGGQTLTRQVTGPSSEVEATFDGFHEQPAKPSTSSTSSTSKPN